MGSTGGQRTALGCHCKCWTSSGATGMSLGDTEVSFGGTGMSLGGTEMPRGLTGMVLEGTGTSLGAAWGHRESPE